MTELSFTQWRNEAENALLELEEQGWHAGDLLADGDRYRRSYPEALTSFQKRWQHYNELKRAAKVFPPDRRRPNLTIKHHAKLAQLELPLQDVWLDDSLRHGWTQLDLAQELRDWKRSTAAPKPPSVTVRSESIPLWEQAATRAGLTLTEWIEQTCTNAVTPTTATVEPHPVAA